MLKVKEVLYQLKSNNVQYIIIGGMAAIAQGSAHLTEDIDICYARDRENLASLVKALSPFAPYLRGAPKDLPFIFDTKTLENGLNFTLSTDIGDIDLLGEVYGIGDYAKVIEFSEVLEIYGFKCSVLTLRGLIKTKSLLARPKDTLILTELAALLQMRKENEAEKNLERYKCIAFSY
jgi:predicted nucleotidyltransferase